MSLGSVQQAVDFLQRVQAVDAKAPIDGAALIQLRRVVADARSTADPFVRVGLLGEFNAGKSTLVNALFGQDVAAADLLEMTSWIAVYRPGTASRCILSLEGGDVEEMAASEFYQRCQHRRWSPEELARITRVDVDVPGTSPGCVLIDPPGLGSITTENEVRLVQALELADLVLWVVDLEAVGSIREVALIERLRREGMPLEVVITKADYADSEDELLELKRYVATKAGVAADAVHAVCALSGDDDSVHGLRRHLSMEVAQARADVRERATAAGLERARAEALTLLRTLGPWLDEEAEEQAQGASRRSIQARGVRQDTLEEMEAWIGEHLLRTQRSAILSSLAAGASFGDALNAHVPPTYLQDFWLSASEEASRRIRELWARCGVDIDVQARPQLTALGFEWREGERQPLLATNDQRFETGMKTALGTAAAATAWAAWLGPAAASISLGAAATGIGIPIALLGAGVAYLFARKGREQQPTESEVLDRVTREFTQAMLLGPISDAVDAVNARVLSGAETTGPDWAASLDEARRIEQLLLPRLGPGA